MDNNDSIIRWMIKIGVKYSAFGYTLRNASKIVRLAYVIFLVLFITLLPSFFITMLIYFATQRDDNIFVVVLILISAPMLYLYYLNKESIRLEDEVREICIFIDVIIDKYGQIKREIVMVLIEFSIIFFLFLTGILFILYKIGTINLTIGILVGVFAVLISYSLVIYGNRVMSNLKRSFRRAILGIILSIMMIVISALGLFKYEMEGIDENIIDIILLAFGLVALIPQTIGDIKDIYNKLYNEHLKMINEERTNVILKCYADKYDAISKCYLFRDTMEMYKALLCNKWNNSDREEKNNLTQKTIFHSVLVVLICVFTILFSQTVKALINHGIIIFFNWYSFNVSMQMEKCIGYFFVILICVFILALLANSAFQKLRKKDIKNALIDAFYFLLFLCAFINYFSRMWIKIW